MIQKALEYKIIRYGLTGGVSTAIHISIAYLYIYFIDTSLFISNVLGFSVAFVFSYLVQSIFVFKHAINFLKAFKYFLVQFGSLLTSILISHYIPLDNNYIKTLIVVLVLPVITYIIHKFWTFKESPDSISTP
jgi:putative flippase GtrA